MFCRERSSGVWNLGAARVLSKTTFVAMLPVAPVVGRIADRAMAGLTNVAPATFSILSASAMMRTTPLVLYKNLGAETDFPKTISVVLRHVGSVAGLAAENLMAAQVPVARVISKKVA